MKRRVSVSLHFLALLALLFQGNVVAQSRRPAKVNLSPENWPQAEQDKYWQMNKLFNFYHPPAESVHGMIAVSSEAFASGIGLEALRQGGSAADAAMATALAQIALTAGSAVSYAGILSMVYYDAATQKVYSLNAGYNTLLGEKDPLSIPEPGKQSGRSALVPGFFAGVQAAHDRFGKLPFASLFEPAIYLAEKGFVMDRALSGRILSQKNFITRLPETMRVFTKENGELYTAGDLFRQPQLAATLRKVATRGAGYIYQGEWAKKFVAAVRNEGGKVTLADMKAYRAIWSIPVQTSYHGYQVYSLGHPSIGGVNLIEALNLLEVADLKRYGHYTKSPEALYESIQICRAGFYFSPLPPEHLKAYAPELSLSPAARVKKQNARLLWQKMHEPGWKNMLEATPAENKGSNHTASVIAVDANGNVAAIVHSSTTVGWGSTSIFVDGVSIPEPASYVQQQIARFKRGTRYPDHSNPVIVLKNRKPYLASGATGLGQHIATLNNLVNVLDFGMRLKTSIDTPNFMGPYMGIDLMRNLRLESQWDQEVFAAGEFAENVIEAVKAKGQAIKVLTTSEAWAQRSLLVAIQIDPKTGKRIGAVPTLANSYVAGY